jgi:hypothetical protein
VRELTAPLILIGILGFSGSSLASEVPMHKHTVEEIKSVCDKTHGSFSQDAQIYGCGTDCHGGPGTDCIVSCKADQTCVAQVIGARRPTNLLNALQTPGTRYAPIRLVVGR